LTKLSIITINYNNADGLQKTIKSVISQTFKNFEYIIIDGHSSDKSIDVIKENENYFAYWCSEKDRGIYDAQNKGIQKAKGDYLLFLNSGDCLENEKVLEKVFALTPKEDLLYGELIFDFGRTTLNKCIRNNSQT
jgi:glycosyltransferase involved in cell wall biosynthesis